MKTFFAENLNLLIHNTKTKQKEIALALGKTQQLITRYLKGESKPSMESVMIVAGFFKVSIDELLFKDMSKYTFEVDGQIITLERQNNILIPVRAQAGKTEDWTQEQFSQFERVHIPGIQGEARTWEVEGDSMEPLIFAGDFVSGKRASINEFVPGGIYVIVTKTQGIHIKKAEWHDAGFLLTPANPQQQPYTLPLSEVREIWNVQVKITRRITRPTVYRDLNAIGEYQFPVIRVERDQDQQ